MGKRSQQRTALSPVKRTRGAPSGKATRAPGVVERVENLPPAMQGSVVWRKALQRVPSPMLAAFRRRAPIRPTPVKLVRTYSRRAGDAVRRVKDNKFDLVTPEAAARGAGVLQTPRTAPEEELRTPVQPVAPATESSSGSIGSASFKTPEPRPSPVRTPDAPEDADQAVPSLPAMPARPSPRGIKKRMRTPPGPNERVSARSGRKLPAKAGPPATATVQLPPLPSIRPTPTMPRPRPPPPPPPPSLPSSPPRPRVSASKTAAKKRGKWTVVDAPPSSLEALPVLYKAGPTGVPHRTVRSPGSAAEKRKRPPRKQHGSKRSRKK